MSSREGEASQYSEKHRDESDTVCYHCAFCAVGQASVSDLTNVSWDSAWTNSHVSAMCQCRE